MSREPMREQVRREFSFENAIPNGPWYTFDVERALDEIIRTRAALAAVEAERDAARVQEALSDAIVDECDSDITTLMQDRAQLRQQLAAAQKVVEAADGYEKWMGKWHDYTRTSGDVPHKQESALIAAVRSYRAALAPQREEPSNG